MLFLLLFSCSSSDPPQQSAVTPTKQVEASPKSIAKKNAGSEESTLIYQAANLSTFTVTPSKEHLFSDPLPTTDVHKASKNALKGMIQQHGILLDNPWALLHSFLALGPDIKLPNGEKALDRLFQDYAILKKYGSQEFVDFPTKKEINGKKILIEPHTDLALKVLTEIGVPANYPIQVQEQKNNSRSSNGIAKSKNASKA